ncbi:hypothetical protein BABINDRAFT_170548 [Babjeviella inositovora NRRL Y-12698]|uniref:RING-type domain-containing protein n=1 Tax=Babjeviella inositovora NRRL Y-12698 TaxID=984486 RepID=A0A1E3QWB2_9ASCO|nr:uncharacterized protein BABINDRAFT_170548 [Babjeviella inositovora NRRL Y-12698]ODQ81963.1 hypothetical protein BABINDRAFT_170548 [Babjeviella inositovora NRRL Y-12698]
MSQTIGRNLRYGAVGTFIGVTIYKRIDAKSILAHHSTFAHTSQFGLVNGFLVLLFLLGQFTKWLIFGKLNPAEIRNLKDHMYFTIWEFVLGLLIVHRIGTSRHGVDGGDNYMTSVTYSLKYGGLFLCVLLLKSFHLLCVDRVNTIFANHDRSVESSWFGLRASFQQRKYTLTHLRFSLGIVLLNFIDLVLIRRFKNEVYHYKNYNLLLVIFGFEIINLYPLIIFTSMKYFLNYREYCQSLGSDEEPLGSHKQQLLNALEFLVNAVRFINYCIFSIIFVHLFTVPLHVLPSSYKCFRIAVNRTRVLIEYKKASLRLLKMARHFTTPGIEGLQLCDWRCTICYGDLVSASGRCRVESGDVSALNESLTGLICGHAFHSECIKSWLVCSTTCPICRRGIAEK